MSDVLPFDGANPALQWRDSVLRALLKLSQPGRANAATLTEIDPDGATILLTTLGRLVAFLTWSEDSFAPMRASERLEIVRSSLRPGMQIDLVIVGGGQAARALCEEKADARFGQGQIRLHHLTTDGALWNAGGPLPRPIEDAVEQVRSDLRRGEALRVISPGEIVAARESFRKMATAEQAASQLLSSGKTPATFALLAALALLFGLELLWSGSGVGPNGEPSLQTLYRMGATDRTALLGGEWWRLITPAFLHGSILHIAANSWSLWVLGRLLERLLGSARFLVLYGVSAIVAAIASSFFGELMSVGASGAIFGLMGALFAIALRPQGILPINMASRLRRSLWPQLILNVYISTMKGIDWHAHLGGAIAGFVMTISGLPAWRLPPLPVRAASGARSRGWTIAAVATMLAMSAALGAALGHSRPWDHRIGPLHRVSLSGTPVSLDIPEVLPLLKEKTAEGGQEFYFGERGRTDAVIVARVSHIPELAHQSPDEIRTHLLRMADEMKQADMPVTSPAQLVDTPEGPVGTLQQALHDWRVDGSVLVRGEYQVEVYLVSWDESPADWRALEPKLVASVKIDAPTP